MLWDFIHLSVNNVPGPLVTASGVASSAGRVTLMSDRELWLTIAVLTFGIFVVLTQAYLIKGVIHRQTDSVLRISLVTLIIVGTLALITAGFSNDQIAPALGLFGTIAGYLIGRQERGSSTDQEIEK